jgi:formamidopyrimidine-DNA glycosylase
MPELPEVEIVVRNLTDMMGPKAVVQEWIFYRPDLRMKLPQAKLNKLVGQKILKIRRRAKFILFEFAEQVVVSHLGMTGAWREEKIGWTKQKHDHVVLVLNKDRFFVYSDPRRFGFIEIWPLEKLAGRFIDYGVEPLASETDFKVLTEQFRMIQAPIKTALMNQKMVVGIGNIYASEILFAACVSPLKKCSKVNHEKYNLIWKMSHKILSRSIEKGGSTIENYRNGKGVEGTFQNEFSVYGRDKEECLICHTPIKQKVMAGRSTFWCPKCQS